jgi:hypothetical protein
MIFQIVLARRKARRRRQDRPVERYKPLTRESVVGKSPNDRRYEDFTRRRDRHKAGVESLIVKRIEAYTILRVDPVGLVAAFGIGFDMACIEKARQLATGYVACTIIGGKHGALEKVTLP